MRDELDGPRPKTAFDAEYVKALDIINQQREEIERLRAALSSAPHDCEAWRREGLGCAVCSRLSAPPDLVTLHADAQEKHDLTALAKKLRKHECPSCDMSDEERERVWGWNEGIDAAFAAISALAETPQGMELELRREWWLGHGHRFGALYGDDGEMQCHECRVRDYRRAPLDDLRPQVEAARRENVARALAAPPPASPQGMERPAPEPYVPEWLDAFWSKQDAKGATCMGCQREG